MKDFETLIYAVFGGVITLAIVSVIISKKANAPAVIQSLASGLGNVVTAAVQPLSGGGNSASVHSGS